MQPLRSTFCAKPTLLTIVCGWMLCLVLSDTTAVAQQHPGIKCVVDGSQQCRTRHSVEFNWGRNQKDKASLGKIFFSNQVAAKKFKSHVVDKLKLDQTPDASLLLKANHQLALTGQVKQQLCPLSGKPMDQKHHLMIAGVRVCFGDAAAKNKAEAFESTWQRAESVFASPAFTNSFVKQVALPKQAVIEVADRSASPLTNNKVAPATPPTNR